MIVRFYKLAVIGLLFCCSCTSSKVNTNSLDTLHAATLHPFGRTIINDRLQLELISSAAHFGFTFHGNECHLYASARGSGHNYLQYELDGAYQKRIRIEGSSTQPIVLKAEKGGTHTVWVYKATEAHTGPILIENIAGKNTKAIQRDTAPLIEFIGNSITCGAAADPSEVACGQGQYHDQHNAYYAYGPRVARELRTNYIVSGVSGIGIYRNWNSSGPAMPEVYEKADFQDRNTQVWNFSKYSPAIVSIALGTNDFSKGDGIKQRLPFDSTAFVTNYIKFVQTIKSKYGAAQIALLSSAMVSGASRVTLQNCLTAVKQKIDALYPSAKPVALHFFQPMQARGCDGHPSVEDHAILAKELVPFFKKLL